MKKHLNINQDRVREKTMIKWKKKQDMVEELLEEILEEEELEEVEECLEVGIITRKLERLRKQVHFNDHN